MSRPEVTVILNTTRVLGAKLFAASTLQRRNRLLSCLMLAPAQAGVKGGPGGDGGEGAPLDRAPDLVLAEDGRPGAVVVAAPADAAKVWQLRQSTHHVVHVAAPGLDQLRALRLRRFSRGQNQPPSASAACRRSTNYGPLFLPPALEGTMAARGGGSAAAAV